jgi:hypothetical protein
METRKVQKGTKIMGQSTVATFPLGKHSFIAEYHNAISPATCSDLISHLSEDFQLIFNEGPTIGGVNKSIKNSMDTSFMDPVIYNPEKMPHIGIYQNFEATIANAVWSCLTSYIEHYPTLWSAPNIVTTGHRIQRYYKNGGFYREHCDGFPWDASLDRQENRIRILAIVVYLNTVEDGGGTVFPLHNYTAQAEVGKIVIFPTTWMFPHMGGVPHSNDKWIVSSFVLCDSDWSQQKDEIVNHITK